MTEQDQKELGNTLWAIADQLRGAMNADDLRDYALVPKLQLGNAVLEAPASCPTQNAA